VDQLDQSPWRSKIRAALTFAGGHHPHALGSTCSSSSVRLVAGLTGRGGVFQLQLEDALLRHQLKVLRRSIGRSIANRRTALRAWIECHNERRPHGRLGGQAQMSGYAGP
jgi:transposase InsO family protein